MFSSCPVGPSLYLPVLSPVDYYGMSYRMAIIIFPPTDNSFQKHFGTNEGEEIDKDTCIF